MIPYATFGPAASAASFSSSISRTRWTGTLSLPSRSLNPAAAASDCSSSLCVPCTSLRSHSFPSTAARSRSCCNFAAGSTACGGATCHQSNTSEGQSHMQSASYINEIQMLCPVKSIVLITTSLPQTPSLGFEKQTTMILCYFRPSRLCRELLQ